MPDNTNTQLLWYRSDLVPNPPKTWAQMLADAAKLKAEGKPHYIEIQGAQYEGATVWFNTMVASAGGTILNSDATKVTLGSPAVKAMSIMKQLATGPGGDPSLDVQKENQNRLAMEAGQAAFELNYPFVYPSMKADNPKLFKNFKWALYPEVTPGVPAKVTIGGTDLAVSAYSKHKALAFQAALCIRDAQNQIIGANVGGVPPTITSLYNNKALFADYPFHADIKQELRERERPAEDARLSGRVHRHLAPDLAAVRYQPGEHEEGDGRPAEQRLAIEGSGPVSRRAACAATAGREGRRGPMSTSTRRWPSERPERRRRKARRRCRKARGPSAGSAGCCAHRRSS